LTQASLLCSTQTLKPMASCNTELAASLRDEKVDPRVVAYVTDKLHLRCLSDFANYWTDAEVDAALQNEVVGMVEPFKTDMPKAASKIQVARLRTSWKKARAQNTSQNSQFSSNGQKRQQFCFVSGASGAGKTTICNVLTDNGYKIFDGDIWCAGGDPINQVDAPVTKEMVASRNPAMAKAVTDAISVGRTKMGKGEPVPWQVWESFYTFMCSAIKSQTAQNGHDKWVIPFAVYREVERNFVRKSLGDAGDVTFILLNVPEAVLAERVFKRTENHAKEQGMTLDEYMARFHPGKTVQQVLDNWKIRRSGFEAKGKSESKTFQIDIFREMTPAMVHAEAKRQLGFTESQAAAKGSSVGMSQASTTQSDQMPLTVVIFGATGDLARKKLYPALYQLMYGCPDAPLIPRTSCIVGFGRSHVDLGKFLAKQCVNVKGNQKEAFLKQCTYFCGAYDEQKSFENLSKHLGGLEGQRPANRLFFFSVPPAVFGTVCTNVKAAACAPNGWTRLLVEKPFGRDSRSFEELNSITSSCFTENQLFRIDHYMGKEVVLNLAALRFGNQLFESFWNREHIASVQIIFKEDLGTEGRGGYFDKSGIIRDIMQNHLMQVFLWLAMEPPKELERNCLQEEKGRLLKAIKTLSLDDCFLGQFSSNTWTVNGVNHHEAGYLDDKGVPRDSTTPTYAAVALNVNNDRWKGVPFLMHAGKGLDERKAEVRITFKRQVFNQLVSGDLNELVIRIQPEEAMYLKFMNKKPGWKQSIVEPAVLDMSYATAFPNSYVADGYERMFFNAFSGDGSLFVGSDELKEAWRIFTPLLDEIERKRPQPVVYPFGVSAPPGMNDFAARYNISLSQGWQEQLLLRGKSMQNLREVFEALDTDKDGTLNVSEIKTLARQFFDGREPTEKQAAQIFQRLDADGDGKLTFSELEHAVESLACFCSAKYDDHAPHQGWHDDAFHGGGAHA